jgi:hypothetical protein
MLFDAGLTAWATVALCILAFAAAIVAGGAWIVQARQLRELRQVNEKQLPVLESQQGELEASRKLREREERERRERFVSQVFSYYEAIPSGSLSQAQLAAGARPARAIRVSVRNTGPVPVYDLTFGVWTDELTYCWQRHIAPLMPGTWASPAESTDGWTWTIPEGVDLDVVTIAVFIRDAAGNRWRVQPWGHYDEYRDGMLPADKSWRTT